MQRPPTGENDDEDTVARSMLGPIVRKQFGTLSTLRAQFSAATTGMSGSGYVWLVTDARRNLAFVPTFAAGTLLVRSRRGTVDPLSLPVLREGMPTEVPLPDHNDLSAQSAPPPPSMADLPLHRGHVFATPSVYDPVTSSPSLGSMSEPDMRNLSTLGDYLYPLFCVSVHEHCWLLDHGVWGREKYIKEFWSVLDWPQVVRRYETFHHSSHP